MLLEIVSRTYRKLIGRASIALITMVLKEVLERFAVLSLMDKRRNMTIMITKKKKGLKLPHLVQRSVDIL